MKNYNQLKRIQTAILKELRDEQLERSTIYQFIRNQCYNSSTSKNQSRQAIKNAINSLKRRGIIYEQMGILGLNN